MGICGVLGTDSVEPVKRLKKPDFVGFGAEEVVLVPSTPERRLAALELGMEAAGVE